MAWRAKVLWDVKLADAGALAVSCVDCAAMLETERGKPLVAQKPCTGELVHGVLLDSIGLCRC